MARLLNLCDELLHEIFTYVDAQDLAQLSATCTTLQSYIRDNKVLWREIYLQHFDEPPNASIFDWEVEIQPGASLIKILECSNLEKKVDDIDCPLSLLVTNTEQRENIVSVANAINTLLLRANPNATKSRTIRYLVNQFESEDNRNVFLFSSSLFGKDSHGVQRAGNEHQISAETEEARQASAMLHTYFGTRHEIPNEEPLRTSHAHARSKVYDLRNYTDDNYWGPYLDDRRYSVDWEMMEAIMVDLSFNLERALGAGARPRMYGSSRDPAFFSFYGITPNSYTPIEDFVCPGARRAAAERALRRAKSPRTALARQPDPPLDSLDPYGVTGTWRRIVCFLDYNDLYHFNFITRNPYSLEPCGPITTPEEIRFITMKIAVCAIEEAGENDHKAYPVVHFRGTSRSVHASWDPNANSQITGTVRVTLNGDVRWTTLSIFQGEARWRSESIQLGGIRSARGLLGTWFDKDLDPNGPAGPTAFYKVCEKDQDHVWDDEVDSDLDGSE